MFAPKGVPKAIVEQLNDALVAALGDDIVRARLLELGADIPQEDQRTPQALADRVKKEVDRWSTIIRAVGMEL
jgi:tripartite-type tricarboxylate transporter receptor subunit TctC